eukprot:scaffold20.g7660.t1
MEAAGGDFRRPPSNSLYQQLAITGVGNALALALLLLLHQLWSLLADYQDALLYALLCSIPLRELKAWLVECIDANLARERSVAWALLSVLALPLTVVGDAYQEACTLMDKWRRYVGLLQEEWKRKNSGSGPRKAAEAGPGRESGSGGNSGLPAAGPGLPLPAADAAADSPATPRAQTVAAGGALGEGATPSVAFAVPPPQSMPTLALYAQAGLHALKSRRTSRKQRKQRQAARTPPVVASSVLFRWLLRACLALLVYEWVRDTWSTTVQLLVLVSTALLALGLLPLLYLTTHRCLGTSVFSPIKTPTAASTAKRGADAFTAGLREQQQRARAAVTPPKPPRFSPAGRGARAAAGDGATAAGAEAAARTAWAATSRWLRGATALCAALWAECETRLRAALRANLHTLVSLLLILALLLGTSGLAAFLTVRVVQEGRSTVLAVRDVFPTAWAGVAASTPLLADAVSDDGGGGGLPESRMLAGLPPWVRAYQADALALVQRALPEAATWVEHRLQQFAHNKNLTSTLRWGAAVRAGAGGAAGCSAPCLRDGRAALRLRRALARPGPRPPLPRSDLRLLYETLHGPRRCSEKEHERLLVALARADLAVLSAAERKAAAEGELEEARRQLSAAVVQLAERCGVVEGRACKAQGAGCVLSSAACGGEVQLLEEAVVAADAAVGAAKAAQKAALQVADEAEKRLRSAQSRLSLCVQGEPEQHPSLLPPALREVGERLQQAYAKLWRRQLREGLADMRAAAVQCVAALRSVAAAQRGGDSIAPDLGTLQRLAQAAADPLVAVARVAAGSVGSTTAAAVMGGLGLVRLGVGVVKFGMQLALFLALLYYLLAARRDPLALAVGVLPLSESGRQRAAGALSRALGGVFLSSMKLVAFHGGFTWLTFRAFSIPLVYTAAVASAVCALLPFIPTYVVALPGCLLLALQGRALAGVLFGLLHFSGYYLGDTVILEDIPGGHPYMLSLGILGGIYTFDNPLQARPSPLAPAGPGCPRGSGCLMGPILLSLLSVFYALHNEFMGTLQADRGGGGSGLGHRLWSLSPPAQQGDQGAAATPAAGWRGAGGLRASPSATLLDPPTSLGSPLQSISLGSGSAFARRRMSITTDRDLGEGEEAGGAGESAGPASSFSFTQELDKLHGD